MLKSHVVLRLETDAGAEDVGKSSALLGKSVDNGSAARSERSLKHVAENAKDAVEARVISGTAIGTVSLPLDTGHHLSDENQIDDQRRGEKRVLTDVE